MATRIAKRDIKKFLKVLAETGSVVDASEAIERDRSHLYTKKAEDPEFATAWDAARMAYMDDLEGQVLDWAMNGYTVSSQEQVVDRDGNQVGMTKRKIEKRYDARLALRVLERRHPDYKPKQEIGGEGGATGVLVVPGTAPSVEAWEAQFGGGDSSDATAGDE